MEKDIRGYEGLFRIRPSGEVRIKRRDTWRTLPPIVGYDGKYSVLLSQYGKDTIKRVHLLVAEHFLEGPVGSKVIHINGNVTDNRVENLKWANRSQSGMTSTDVQNIRKAYEERAATQRDLAERYNVTPMTIHNIVTRKTWKHVK